HRPIIACVRSRQRRSLAGPGSSRSSDLAPNAEPFLPGSSSPDAEAKGVAQGEVQARCPHGAGLADLLRLVGLSPCRAGRAFREEQFGIVVTARGAVTPVRKSPLACPECL